MDACEADGEGFPNRRPESHPGKRPHWGLGWTGRWTERGTRLPPTGVPTNDKTVAGFPRKKRVRRRLQKAPGSRAAALQGSRGKSATKHASPPGGCPGHLPTKVQQEGPMRRSAHAPTDAGRPAGPKQRWVANFGLRGPIGPVAPGSAPCSKRAAPERPSSRNERPGLGRGFREAKQRTRWPRLHGPQTIGATRGSRSGPDWPGSLLLAPADLPGQPEGWRLSTRAVAHSRRPQGARLPAPRSPAAQARGANVPRTPDRAPKALRPRGLKPPPGGLLQQASWSVPKRTG
jgi:hypothetical protein